MGAFETSMSSFSRTTRREIFVGPAPLDSSPGLRTIPGRSPYCHATPSETLSTLSLQESSRRDALSFRNRGNLPPQDRPISILCPSHV